MPFTVDEYRIGQLYTTNAESRANTDGDSAIQILENRPFDNDDFGHGQYTLKRIHFGSKLPRFLDYLLPASYKVCDEESYNTYPICRTEYKHEKYPGSKMFVRTIHVPDDKGQQQNVFNLSAKQLQERQVVFLDLAVDGLAGKPASRNPRLCRSEKTGRGPLAPGWLSNPDTPFMCAYKLIDCTFDSYMLWAASGQFANYVRDMMLAFNQYVFCLLDEWHGLTIEDIRNMESQFKEEAEKILKVSGIEEKERPPSQVRSANI